MVGLAGEVLLALDRAIILPCRFETKDDAASFRGSQTRPKARATHSSTPTHFPAENDGLDPVHRTWPTPAETETFAPTGASMVVIVAWLAGESDAAA